MRRELVLRAGGSTHRVRVVSDDTVEIDDRRVTVKVSPADQSTLVVTAGGARYTVHVALDGERAWAMAGGESFVIEPPVDASADAERADGTAALYASGASSESDDSALSAPMPATVTAVLVHRGDRVAAGEPLVRLEAMKMEYLVAAPRAGRVAVVDCRAGDLVQPGRPLVTLERDTGNGQSDATAGA